MKPKTTWQQRIADFNGLSLQLGGTDVDHLPENLEVRFQLNLTDCLRLESLPVGLKAGSLILSGCRNLKSLPEGIEASFLDISGCTQLDTWPAEGRLEAGRLRARNCSGLQNLPDWLRSISQLDLRGCSGIDRLPDGLQVSSWIDLADTGIRELPPSLQRCGLRWKGVPIDSRIAFHPDTISGIEVLQEENAELRRVMLERVGFDRFLDEVQAETLDKDCDAGGERRLLKVDLPGDEPLVCVSVYCPSTGRQYMIRVPPEMTSCHQAIAWTAGFDDPELYRSLVET